MKPGTHEQLWDIAQTIEELSPKLRHRGTLGYIDKLPEKIWPRLLFRLVLGDIGEQLEIGLIKAVISISFRRHWQGPAGSN